MIDYTKYKWLDVQASLPESAQIKEKEAKRLLDTLDKKDFTSAKKDILARYYFDQCEKYAQEDRLDQIKLDSNLTRDFRSWPKSSSFKKMVEQGVQSDKGKFVMSGIVIVMTGTLLVFFLVAILTGKFLFNIWVDGIVGALSIVFLYRNMKIKYRLVKRYTASRDYLYLDIASFVLCFLLKIILKLQKNYCHLFKTAQVCFIQSKQFVHI